MQLTECKKNATRQKYIKDYSDCWNVQHSNHTEPETHLYSLELWKFLCDMMSDSFVVCDGKIVVGYWLGFLKVNPHEPQPDVWCLAIDVCTHADYREKCDGFNYASCNCISPKNIQKNTQKGNTAMVIGIMTKRGFNKGEYNAKTNNHYWSFEQEGWSTTR